TDTYLSTSTAITFDAPASGWWNLYDDAVAPAGAIQAQIEITVPDTSFIPRTPTEQLAIYGAKLRIERGIRYGNGDVETVPV
ncbi:DUF5047 domain-containing protein, partial [Streptomyces sp. A73]|nr:DUF5047 domain-containing protein [Streptomyces sp. A73]